MLESTQTGTTRNSSYHASIYDNDYLELVWKNGQVIVQGCSSRTRQNTTSSSSCIGYSKEPNKKYACIAKSAKLCKSHSLLDSSHGNSHQSSDQNSCQFDLLYSKSKSNYSKESKLTCLSSSKIQYLPNSSASAPFKKPRIMDSSQTHEPSNSLIQNLGKANNNFSHASRPSSSVHIAKPTKYNVKIATLPTKNRVLERVNATKTTEVEEEVAESATDANSVVIDSSRGTRAHIVGIQGKNPLISDTSNQVLSFVARSKESTNSSVLKEKRKADSNLCNDSLVESSSICSLGGSSNFDTCSWKQEETDDNDEETEDTMMEKDAREGRRVKRSKSAETHNSSEKKRRDKINKKMRVLKELIPNCNKVDKASMLDDAIEYLTNLKLQLQIMSMGAGLCKPLMMLPTSHHHHMMNSPSHLPHQLMGSRMGFRPGISPFNLQQFPIQPLSAAGITDINRVRMFGFHNHPFLPVMPIMSHAPSFIPMVANPSTKPLQPTCSATATNLA